MIIESSDVFKHWLASALAPLSDANPESLARYVYALVKKDKPIDELRDLMIEQLDVFLREETKGFVQLIFKNIESKEYLSFKKPVTEVTPAPLKEESKEEPTSSVEPPIAANPPPPEPSKEPEQVTTSSEERPAQIQSSVVSDSTPKEKEEPAKQPEKKDEKKKEVADRDDRFRLNRSRLKHTDVGNRDRSRSRSWGRTGVRRSRSRERPDLRERLDRDRDLRERLDLARERPDREQRERDRRERMPAYRNKSPPPRRYERRKSYSSRSPSPARHRGASRSRSRSPKFPSRRFRNSSRSRSRSRERDSPRSPRSYDLLKDELLKSNRQKFQERRCPDFELKGFCLRGELCPYDHGTDPLVVPDLSSRIPPLQYPPPGMAGGPPMNLPPPGLLPPIVPPPHIPPPQMMLRPPPNMEYSPDAPSMNANMWPNRPGPFGFHGPRMMHPPGYNPHARDLINVPVDHPYPNGRHPGRRGPGFMSGNCCLDIKKIPIGINNITHLNNHFAKFGKIINIQVNYNNDPEAAMITFSSPAEATAAYKSTEAVLNNRFIKVLWHQQDGRGNANGNVKERLGPHMPTSQATPPGTDGVTVNTPTCLIKKPTVAVDPLKRENQEDNKAKEIADIKANQELLEKNQMVRQKAADNRKELTDLSSELIKRSQALLDKHISQQKELLNKLATPGLDEKTKTAIKDAIKAVQEQIEKVKEQVVAQTIIKKPPAKRTKEEIQKEILDTELDIISKQQEGGDLVPLYKKMQNLKMELNKAHAVAGGRVVRPQHPAAVRHSVYSTNNMVRVNTAQGGKPAAYRPPAPPVDNRPTKLLVSGYENDEKDQVLAHFREYGEIADYIADDSTPSIVLNFKTRQEAESAMNQGKSFQDRLLTVTWFSTPQLPARRRNSSTGGGPSYHMHAGRQVLLSGSDSEPMPDPIYINKSSDQEDEERALDSGEEFLLQDDDEDAEDDREERSWRR